MSSLEGTYEHKTDGEETILQPLTLQLVLILRLQSRVCRGKPESKQCH